MSNQIEEKIHEALQTYTIEMVAAVMHFMREDLTVETLTAYDGKVRTQIEQFEKRVHEALATPLGSKRCIMHDNDAQCCRFIAVE